MLKIKNVSFRGKSRGKSGRKLFSNISSIGKSFLILVVGIILAGGFSVWATSIGNDISVSGNFDTSGTVTANGGVTIGDASGDTLTANSASWTFANDTNFVLSGGVNGLSFDTNTFSVDSTNDRVGIGTTTPGAVFSVNGNTLLAHNVTFDSNYIYIGSSTAASTTITWRGSATSTLVSDIVNAWSIATTTLAANNSTSTIFSVGSSGGLPRIGVATSSPFAMFSIHGFPGQAQFAVGSSSQTNFIVDSLGNIGIGTSTTSGLLSIRGKGTGTGRLSYFEDSAGTARFVMQDNGRVGIGTTTPSGLFSLSSINGALTNAELFLSGISTIYASSSTSTIALADANAFQYATSTDGTGGIPLVKYNTSATRVGISTTTPGATLAVAGDGTLLVAGSGGTSTITVQSGRTNGTGRGGCIQMMTTDGVTTVSLMATTSGQFAVWTAGPCRP